MAHIHFKGKGVTVELEDVRTKELLYPPLNEDYTPPYGSYHITITADDGVTIESVHYFNDGWDEDAYFTISEDGKVATEKSFNFNQFTETVFTIVTTGTGDDGNDGGDGGDGGDGSSVNGFTNLYLVDREVLKSIASEDLIKTWGEPATSIRVDLRDYIINVLELPFSIPVDLIGDDSPIRLGEYELETVAKEIKQDLLFLDLGTISVPSKYNNSYDFMDTTVKLYLPFIDEITLDVEYIINQEIYIQYVIDLFTGDTTVNITSSRTGKNIYSKNHKLGRSIPFNAKNNVVVNRLSEVSGLYNEVYTPYIEVTRNKVNNLNEFNNMVDVEGVLLYEKGFITVNEIDLKTSATYEEKNRIKQLLSDGVIIK